MTEAELALVWPSLLTFIEARRGRRTAVKVIAPMIEKSRSRLQTIPDSVWLDPYMIGFLVMLITVVARREGGVRDTRALRVVQSQAWGEFTGLQAALIGEEVIHLDSVQDNDFGLGCRNAMDYGAALYCRELSGNGDQAIVLDAGDSFGRMLTTHLPANENLEHETALAALWVRYFDEHVAPQPVGTERIW